MQHEGPQVVEAEDESAAVDTARECLYRFLSIALSDPNVTPCGKGLDTGSLRFAQEAAALLRDEVAGQVVDLAFGELPPEHLELRPLITGLSGNRAELRSEYDRVFGLVVPRECPPYETEYHRSADASFRSQQLADIAGFYRAFGLETTRSRAERPDHLSLELEFIAFLLMKKRLALQGADDNPDALDQARRCDDARQTFLREHLAWWVPAFTMGLRRKTDSGYYAAAAGVLAALIATDRHLLGVPAPSVPAQPALIERPEEQPSCAACPLRL